MARTETLGEKKALASDMDMYESMREFFAKFIFTPEKEDEAYAHLTKDLTINNLRSNLHEPESARELLKAFHVITHKNYFWEEEVDVDPKFLGLDPETKEKIYDKETKTVEVSMFPRSFHRLRSKWISFVTTSLARDGHLMKAFKTTKFEKTESIEEKTEAPKKNYFGGRN